MVITVLILVIRFRWERWSVEVGEGRLKSRLLWRACVVFEREIIRWLSRVFSWIEGELNGRGRVVRWPCWKFGELVYWRILRTIE